MSLYGISFSEVLVTAQGDGNAVTAAAATSLLTGSAVAAKYTLPANFFSIGKQLLVKATGRVSVVQTTPGTLRFDVRFGANVVADGQAIGLTTTNAAYTNVNWELEFLLTCRAIGTSANMHQGGWFSAPAMITGGSNAAMPTAGSVANLPWNTAPAVGANFDSTATQQVDLFFTQTAATGSITLHQYSLISLN